MYVKKFGKQFTIKWWQGEELSKRVALDTETELIKGPGHTPRLVISAAYDGNNNIYLIKNSEIKHFLDMHKHVTYAFHNAAFDLRVLSQFTGFDFHEMLMKNQIKDTAILYRLAYLATIGQEAFRYSLDHCVKEIHNVELPKDEEIRLTFGQFLGDTRVHYEKMGDRHLEYAALDPVATWYIWESLNKKFYEIPTSNQCAHYIHLLGDIALDKVRNYGIGVDLEYVENLRSEWEDKMTLNAKILKTYGLERGQKGFKANYEAAISRLGIELPRTGKTNRMSMSREHLEPYRHEPFVDCLLEYLELEKLKNFLNDLTASRVYPRYSTIKKTGRTSCSKPNIQNPPRAGGVREAFVPKKGHTFISIDYSSIELYALAQVLKNLFGHSVLFDKLKEGVDIHIYAAGETFNKPELEVTLDERQIAKICNYGLAANMSPRTFMNHMKTQGVEMSLEETKKVKNAWKKAFPEIEKFWKRGYGRQQFVSQTGFVRNNCSYTQYLNIHFQSLVAEGCKIMLYFVQKAGYDIVAFIHDEILVEHPIESAKEAMPKIQKIMEESMQKIIPDLPIKTEGKLIARFQK